MSAKRTSSALITSILIHFVLVLIAGLYFLVQTETFQHLIGIEKVDLSVSSKPQVREHIIKPIVPIENKVVVPQVQGQPRLATLFHKITDADVPSTSLEYSNRSIKVNAPINTNVPKVVKPDVPVPEVVTQPDLPKPRLQRTAPFVGTSASVPSASVAHIARGVAGHQVQVKITFERPPGLSMIQNVGVARGALDSIVERTTQLGNDEIPSPPQGEPYGHVVGRGRDIRGVLRFTRIRHSLSDWWADSSSLNALTKWLNEKTKIRTDMNVEGGAIKLTDANLLKTPLTFMTGHDPSLTRSRNLLGRQYGGEKMDSRFTRTEAAGLRKYLVEKGGFLVFDDCGVNAPAQAMVRLFISQMRYVMPEYQIQRIDNKHEIYNNFYDMGGPPIGMDIFWWGTRPPKRNFLEGISVGDKLSVLVVRRDYMCAMESVSIPTRSVHYSPGVYRFMTNVVVYALTHGAIANYSNYVPENAFAKKELPTRAPQAANIRATD